MCTCTSYTCMYMYTVCLILLDDPVTCMALPLLQLHPHSLPSPHCLGNNSCFPQSKIVTSDLPGFRPMPVPLLDGDNSSEQSLVILKEHRKHLITCYIYSSWHVHVCHAPATLTYTQYSKNLYIQCSARIHVCTYAHVYTYSVCIYMYMYMNNHVHSAPQSKKKENREERKKEESHGIKPQQLILL